MARYFDARRNTRDELRGREIFEITPIILGGSATDLQNKTVLTREQHIEACCYWNKIISDLRRKNFN